MDIYDRFFNKVSKTDYCWNWIGALRGNSGYGSFKLKGKNISAHRLSYIIHFGDIPKDLMVCHKCDNRLCVNPEHLFLGTAKDNVMDAIKKGRIIPPNNNKILKHPGEYAYRKGCRCPDCKKIKRDKLRIFRAGKKK